MSLLTNLIAYYPLNGNSNDVGGNGYNGTDSSVSYGYNYANNAILGQGAHYVSTSSAYTVLPSGFNSAFTPRSNSISMSCWIYVTSLATEQGIIAAGNTAGGNDVFYLYVVGSANKTGWGMGGSILYEIDITSIAINTWYHVVCVGSYITATTGTMTLYVNGSSVGTKSYNPTIIGVFSGTTTMNYGRFGAYAGGLYENGNLTQVGWWNRELTTAEITQLYNRGYGITYPFISPNMTVFFQN